jgi:hypothetical protein
MKHRPNHFRITEVDAVPTINLNPYRKTGPQERTPQKHIPQSSPAGAILLSKHRRFNNPSQEH